MDTTWIQPLFDQGGALLLAGVMIFIMKSWHDDSVKRSTERAAEAKRDHEIQIQRLQIESDSHKQDKQVLADIVKANTESNIRLISVVERIERFITERIKD